VVLVIGCLFCGASYWLSVCMMATLKFEVPLFDGSTDFMLWQCTIQDYLVQQGLESALSEEKPSGIKDEE